MFVQTLEVDIMPKGKERPRVGNYGHIYTPPAQFEHERAIRGAWMAKYGIEPVSERCPVAVTISFSKTLPKSVILSHSLRSAVPPCARGHRFTTGLLPNRLV